MNTQTVIENDIEYTVITCNYGSKRWFLNKQLHRVVGPAVIYASGDQAWCVHGRFHREDGPAILYNDGTHRWYYQGVQIDVTTQAEFEHWLRLKAFQ